jgi:uncharacterized protein YbjQ (UPF0145 family)
MFITTTNEVAGYRIDAVLGEVMGLSVRSPNASTAFGAGFRALSGGEVPEMTQMVYEGRQQVMQRMADQAKSRGANAVIAMRFDASPMGEAWTELCAYGTAVIVLPIPAGEPGSTSQSAAAPLA